MSDERVQIRRYSRFRWVASVPPSEGMRWRGDYPIVFAWTERGARRKAERRRVLYDAKIGVGASDE